MAITTPKETNCDTTGCRNALQVGEETTFSAYIKNSGDANIVEMGYTVTIYAADSSGNAGNIAVGADGSPLQWSNPDVMCDDITVCYRDGAADPLAPNAFLGGGKETLRLQGGGDITWTPTLGEYLVEVKVNSPEDADVANNAQLITVVVEDWNDIEVDLQWTVGNDPDVLDASGGGDGDFKLIVMANGSDTFTPREVQIRLHVTQNTAMVDSAQIGTTAFPLDGTGVLVTAGVQQTVEVFMNESDPNGSTLDARNVLDYQTAWEVSGVLVPGLDSNAQFEITAELESYTLYGPFEDCMETYTEDGEDEENTTIWMNSCEVVFTSDDRPKTDADEIFGTKITYDDIRISLWASSKDTTRTAQALAVRSPKKAKSPTSTSVVASCMLKSCTEEATRTRTTVGTSPTRFKRTELSWQTASSTNALKVRACPTCTSLWATPEEHRPPALLA